MSNMTDADRLRDIASQLRGAFASQEVRRYWADDLLRIAALLDAVPPETLEAIKAGTWKVVPIAPTRKMAKAGRQDWACADREQKAMYDYGAMLAAAPAKPEGGG